MATPAKRALGALLALIGLLVAGLGLWFTSHLGTGGDARFTIKPSGTGPIVIGPSVLNRVDLPLHIEATGTPGSSVWMGLAAPMDARSALGNGALRTVEKVLVKDWSLVTRQDGKGESPQLSHADLWRVQNTGLAASSMNVNQANAPETLVITATDGQVSSVTMTWTKSSWFVQSLLVLVTGLLLAAAGVGMVVTAGRRGALTRIPAPRRPAQAESRHASRGGSR